MYGKHHITSKYLSQGKYCYDNLAQPYYQKDFIRLMPYPVVDRVHVLFNVKCYAELWSKGGSTFDWTTIIITPETHYLCNSDKANLKEGFS